MRVLVVGNSIAGRSVVSMLMRSRVASEITSLQVLDSNPAPLSCSTVNIAEQFYTSLWSPSFEILHKHLQIQKLDYNH